MFAFPIFTNMEELHVDIIILGAGPAGSTLTAYLKDSGHSIAVIDKAHFPRDKVCGDAIPGPAVRILRGISPATSQRFDAFQHKRLSRGGTAIAPNHTAFSIQFQTEGYISKRIDFDNFLFEEAKLNQHAHFFLGETITDIENKDASVTLSLKNSGLQIKAKMIIGCDGANSVVVRKFVKRAINRAHHCGAVRAYFEHVQMQDESMMEFYFLKGYLPGYFWVFPLENNCFNLGFGMLSKDISERKINLKESLKSLIANDPLVKEAFREAKLIGNIKGFGLPLGSMKRAISGNRFLLCGDAAALIDPATGEGIGNAMISAKIAAEHIIQCFEKNRFDAAFNKAYDKAVYQKLWRQLRMKYLIQKFLKDRYWLLNFIINRAAKNPWLRKIIGKIF